MRITSLLAAVIMGLSAAAMGQGFDPATANNDFAVRLYAKVGADPANTFFSPSSISTALAMTALGARGQTEKQMYAVLAMDGAPAEKVHQACSAMIAGWNDNRPDRGYQFAVANRLWGQKGFHFLPAFLNQTREFYKAGLEEVDFVGATEEARRTINAWVEKQTNDKIKELLQRGILTRDSRLVLTNAIYFKGNWDLPFKKSETTAQPFFQGSSDKKGEAQMMSQTGRFRYREDDSMQILEMSYGKNELAMDILLPRKVDGLAEMEKQLARPGWLAKATGELRPRMVKVWVPKFKMESKFELGKVLSGLGMTDAFDAGKANFTGISTQEPLYISHVIHQAYVDMNEEGTEAAAATAVVVTRGGAPARPAEFRADHPFVFLIRDVKTGTILFMGKVVSIYSN